MASEKQKLFMDQVHAWTFEEKVKKIKYNPEIMEIKRIFRNKIRNAQRFILDDSSVETICELSHETKHIEGWSFLARLPYNVMWIEYNAHTKASKFESMGKLGMPFNPKEVSPWRGYLMWKEELEGSSPRWIVHSFTFIDNMVVPEFTAYVFDPEGNSQFPTRGSSFWRVPTLSLIPDFPRMPVIIQEENNEKIFTETDPEYILLGMFEDTTFSHVENIIKISDIIAPRMAVVINPFWDKFIKKNKKLDFKRLALENIRENAGELRWIITMLASINGLPKEVKPFIPQGIRHSIGMHQLPYFGGSTISLSIPRENRVIHFRKILDKEAGAMRRRRHYVIGHWRIIEPGKRMFICRHMPISVEAGVGQCERCGLKVRWIEAHERGDATLGYVEHQYNVTSD